jgi:hypothetical protein
MRLLKYDGQGKCSLTKYLLGDEIPPYTILSHTWGPASGEVTYQDLVDSTGQEKPGYDKIRFCMNLTERHGADGPSHFWVDSCCIDQKNQVELSEAINSMFRWYRNATRCYVYLSDVSATTCVHLSRESAIRNSRWFTRGWTLQELLAPEFVQFFTNDGILLGDKISLQQQIHETTGIAIPALCGEPLNTFGIEERFKWAESRNTTREEDWAYSLLGVFGITIPLIYGEGKENAVRRLRREIEFNGSPNVAPCK